MLGLYDTTAEEIKLILDSAGTMKQLLAQNAKKMPHLQGKSIVALFYEDSTRTRLSFELAAKFLGATFSNLGVSSSSVKKGETLLDTGKTIAAMETDVIVIRHPLGGAPTGRFGGAIDRPLAPRRFRGGRVGGGLLVGLGGTGHSRQG